MSNEYQLSLRQEPLSALAGIKPIKREEERNNPHGLNPQEIAAQIWHALKSPIEKRSRAEFSQAAYSSTSSDTAHQNTVSFGNGLLEQAMRAKFSTESIDGGNQQTIKVELENHFEGSIGKTRTSEGLISDGLVQAQRDIRSRQISVDQKVELEVSFESDNASSMIFLVQQTAKLARDWALISMNRLKEIMREFGDTSGELQAEVNAFEKLHESASFEVDKTVMRNLNKNPHLQDFFLSKNSDKPTAADIFGVAFGMSADQGRNDAWEQLGRMPKESLLSILTNPMSDMSSKSEENPQTKVFDLLLEEDERRTREFLEVKVEDDGDGSQQIEARRIKQEEERKRLFFSQSRNRHQ